MSSKSKIVSLNQGKESQKSKTHGDDTPSSAPQGRAVEASKPLQAVCDIALEQVSQLMASFFDHADDVFFELADRAATQNDQRVYFESMRALRQAKDQITFQTLQNLRELFQQVCVAPMVFERPQFSQHLSSEDQTPQSFTVVKEPDVFEAKMAIDGMVAKAFKNFSRPLAHLSLRIDGLLHQVDVSDDSNPLGPAAICHCFQKAFHDFSFNVKAVLIVYKLFDKYVMTQLLPVYERANQSLIEYGVLPNVSTQSQPQQQNEDKKATSSRRGSAEQRQLFKVLQQLLARQSEQQTSSAAPAQGPKLKRTVLLKALQFLQQQSFDRGLPAADHQVEQPYQAIDVTQQILDIVTRTSLVKQSGMVVSAEMIESGDRDLIRLVAMLFDYIFSDNQTPKELKHWLAYLQIPLVKVALTTPNFFNHSDHPARRLVNQIANIGNGWNALDTHRNERLLAMIKKVVKRVLIEYKHDARVFGPLFEAFQRDCDIEEERHALQEQQTCAAEHGRVKAQTAQQAVDFSVRQRIQNCTLSPSSPALDAMIRQGWSQVLYLIWLRHEGECKEWRESLDTLDLLVWSLSPKDTQLEFDSFIKQLPLLLSALQIGLRRISYSPLEMNRAFSELEQIHLSFAEQVNLPRSSSPYNNLDEPEDEWSMRPYDDLDLMDHEQAVQSYRQELVDTIQMIYQRQAEKQAETAVKWSDDSSTHDSNGININISLALNSLESEPARYEDLHEAARTMDEHWFLRVDHLKEGEWLTFETPSGQPYSAKLATILPQTEQYVFVNRYGEKLFEKTREQLAMGFKMKNVKTVDKNPVLDRAMDQLVEKLKDKL